MTRSSRTALVLSGGGARGAYEAGVLAHLFEHVVPALPDAFEFDILSGTSVGAIHAAYTAATAGLPPAERAARIAKVWEEMQIDDVIDLTVRDLLGIPLRALGITQLTRRLRGHPEEEEGIVGGLVDFSNLERLITETIPFERIPANLADRRPSVVCVSCTEVRSGRVTVFMDGPHADTSPWEFDPNAHALRARIAPEHVQASAAIPFLFPAVLVDHRYYVDGGLRMNTPLSPALRLRADRVLVVALKHAPRSSAGLPTYPDKVISQPAFLIGKVLNALMLDQLEYEVDRVELVNAWIAEGEQVYGEGFLPRLNEAVRERRGVGYRPVRTAVIRPSEDLGAVASVCAHGRDRATLGPLGALLARAAQRGVPEGEADLLSYLYFDRGFTGRCVALGRQDAEAAHDEIMHLLAD